MYLTNFDELSPLRDVSRLQRDLNRLFNDFTTAPRRVFPAVNLLTGENSVVVTAELPGIEDKDIKLSVTDQNLIIEGNRQEYNLKENETFHRQERTSGEFKRSIQLPFPVSMDDVSAQFKNGILTITLSRAEEDKPRKINIES